jgi:hypothetical protein
VTVLYLMRVDPAVVPTPPARAKTPANQRGGNVF